MMETPLPLAPHEWQDPIVQELHEVRERLVEQHKGNLHSYSEAARAKAIALGFKFAQARNPPSTLEAT